MNMMKGKHIKQTVHITQQNSSLFTKSVICVSMVTYNKPIALRFIYILINLFIYHAMMYTGLYAN